MLAEDVETSPPSDMRAVMVYLREFGQLYGLFGSCSPSQVTLKRVSNASKSFGGIYQIFLVVSIHHCTDNLLVVLMRSA